MSICLKRIVICHEWDSNPRLHLKTRRFVIISLVKDFDLELLGRPDHTRAESVKYSELKLGGTIPKRLPEYALAELTNVKKKITLKYCFFFFFLAFPRFL